MAESRGSTRVAVAAGIGTVLLAAVLALLISTDGDAESTADDPPPTSQATPEANTPTPEPTTAPEPTATTAPEPTATTAPEPVAPAPDPPPTPTLQPDRDPTPTSEPTPDATPTPAPTLTIAATTPTPTPSVTSEPTPSSEPTPAPTPTLEPIPLPRTAPSVATEPPKPEPPEPEPPKPEPPLPKNIPVLVEPKPSQSYLDFLNQNGLFDPGDEDETWCHRFDSVPTTRVAMLLSIPQHGQDTAFLCLWPEAPIDGAYVSLVDPQGNSIVQVGLARDGGNLIGQIGGPPGDRRYVGHITGFREFTAEQQVVQLPIVLDEDRPVGEWLLQLTSPLEELAGPISVFNFCTDEPPDGYAGRNPILSLQDQRAVPLARPIGPVNTELLPDFTNIVNCRLLPDVVGVDLVDVRAVVEAHAVNAGYEVSFDGVGHCGVAEVEATGQLVSDGVDVVDRFGFADGSASLEYINPSASGSVEPVVVYLTIGCPTFGDLPQIGTSLDETDAALSDLQLIYTDWQWILDDSCANAPSISGYTALPPLYLGGSRFDDSPLPAAGSDYTANTTFLAPRISVRCD